MRISEAHRRSEFYKGFYHLVSAIQNDTRSSVDTWEKRNNFVMMLLEKKGTLENLILHK